MKRSLTKSRRAQALERARLPADAEDRDGFAAQRRHVLEDTFSGFIMFCLHEGVHDSAVG